jgi:hypothetical protein
MQALQNIAVINGRPSIWGDAALALVRGSAVCDDVIETIDGSGDQRTATCVAKRVGKEPVPRTFSVADAKKANLWGKAGPWQQYPDRMLQQRARGFALRDAFPDVLRGVITAEEAQDIPRDPVNVTPPRSTPQAIPHNPETGEVAEGLTGPQIGGVKRRATAAAKKGAEAFRDLWRELSAQERDVLRPDLEAYQDAAKKADTPAEDDAFGLKPADHLANVITAGLESAETPEEVDALVAENAVALNEIPHENWLPLQAAIDARRATLAGEPVHG